MSAIVDALLSEHDRQTERTLLVWRWRTCADPNKHQTLGPPVVDPPEHQSSNVGAA